MIISHFLADYQVLAIEVYVREAVRRLTQRLCLYSVFIHEASIYTKEAFI